MLLSVPGLASAQPDLRHVPPSLVPSIARDSPEGLIKLNVVVTDASGKPVSGLQRADFNLFENSRPQNILSFQAFHGRGAGTEPPVKVILLIDTIELAMDLARNERLAAEAYLRKDGGHLARPVSVFLLSDTGLWTLTHSSSDGNVLVHEIEHNDLTSVRHNMGWKRGAIPSTGDLKNTPSQSALEALAQIATDERRMPGRKLLLWIGPGWSIGSGAYADAKAGSPSVFGTVCWFSALLREAQLALYSFTVGESNITDTSPSDPLHMGTELYKSYLDGVRTPHKANFMNLYRKVLAVQSGGRVVDDSLDLEQEIENCVQDDGFFYRISFDPAAADHLDEYHDLRVEVNQPGLTARTNTGYYDQPYYSVNPIPVPRRISLRELQKLLEADESDADKAKQLSGLELTERLSAHRLSSLFDIVHGKRTRQELRILADASAFLDPPFDEIPTAPPPDAAAQHHMLSLISAYLNTTIRKLPDLFANRKMVRYQETPMFLEGGEDVNYQPLHVTDSSTTTVRYRNGFEITETRPPRRKHNDPELITYGVFGPALNEVAEAIDKPGALIWNRWEQGAAGYLAVFRYFVPADKSLYQVWLCCLPDGDGTEAYQRYAGYHVDIAVDPDSGAVLRLQIQVDLKSTVPMSRSGIMIEYGPIAIGGKTYICPLRSVSIMRSRSVRVLSEWDVSFRTYGPYETMLNEMTFDSYHMFRSESRMLSGFTPDEK